MPYVKAEPANQTIMAPLSITYVNVHGFRHMITEHHHFASPHDFTVQTTPENIEVRVTVFQVPHTSFFIEDRACSDPQFNSVFPSAGSGCASIEAYYAEEYLYLPASPSIGSIILPTPTLIAILDRTIQALQTLISLEREEYSPDFENATEREAFLETFLKDETCMLQAVQSWHTTLVQEHTATLRQRAAKVIQRAYREASGNPAHPMCQRRIQREFEQFDTCVPK